MALEHFKLETDDRGITVITLENPPVNAFSFAVLREIGELADTLKATDETRVAILVGSPKCRAWIGGADLNDFLGLDYEKRLKRYDLVLDSYRRFYELDRPIIAAINGHAVGAGPAFAALCDIRVASNEAFFSLPEVDRGIPAAGGTFMTRLGMPAGRIREMIYTGSRFMAEDLRDTGFFNYIVPRDQVFPKAMEIAEIIAKKSLPALKVNKACNNLVEGLRWFEAYEATHEYGARLTTGSDAKEGIRAFLERREPSYRDG